MALIGHGDGESRPLSRRIFLLLRGFAGKAASDAGKGAGSRDRFKSFHEIAFERV